MGFLSAFLFLFTLSWVVTGLSSNPALSADFRRWEARLREDSPARAAFTAEICAAQPNLLKCATFIAAEERCSDPLANTVDEVEEAIDELAERAQKLARLSHEVDGGVGADPPPETIARAVTRTLWAKTDGDGSSNSESDPLLQGFARDPEPYYEPTLIDAVLRCSSEPLRGVDPTLAVICGSVCGRAGVPMRPALSPSRVLLVPVAPAPPTFHVDVRDGEVCSGADGTTEPPPKTLISDLAITARMLRGLRTVFASSSAKYSDDDDDALLIINHKVARGFDPVRLLGAAERTLLVGDVESDAVPAATRAACHVECALCICALDDVTRRTEARAHVYAALSYDGVAPSVRGFLRQWLNGDWFSERGGSGDS